MTDRDRLLDLLRRSQSAVSIVYLMYRQDAARRPDAESLAARDEMAELYREIGEALGQAGNV